MRVFHDKRKGKGYCNLRESLKGYRINLAYLGLCKNAVALDHRVFKIGYSDEAEKAD